MVARSLKKNRRETEVNILVAAVTHFAEKGYDGARVDEIAAEAGVNKATLYYHIGDKEKLYERVMDQVLGTISNQVAENIKKAPTDEDRLRAFVLTLARNAGVNQYFAPMILREIASGGTNLPDTVMLKMMQVFGALFCILEEGQAAGHFRSVNPLVVYKMIIGGLAFYIAGAHLREKICSLGEAEFELELDVSSEAAVEQFADLVVNAVKR